MGSSATTGFGRVIVANPFFRRDPPVATYTGKRFSGRCRKPSLYLATTSRSLVVLGMSGFLLKTEI